jgi:hypothetical protein
MATFSKIKLSGSTNGKAIKVVQTASTGTTIHATGTSSSVIDEIWLYAYNGHSSSVSLTVQFGGTATPDDDIKLTIPAVSGLTLVVAGLILSGDGSTASTTRAYASTANVVTISGYVNRIS